MTFGYCQLAQAESLSGNWNEAHRALDQAESHIEEFDTMRNMQAHIEAMRAEAWCGLGDGPRAHRALERAFEAIEQLPGSIAPVLGELARARVLCTFASEPAEVDASLDRAAELIDEAEMLGLRPEVHLLRATLRTRDGDAEGAEREREEALRLYRDMGADHQVRCLEREPG